ncbi:Major Facilitator Superfamily [Geosmithia morbida]|uniref:Major Facilitator Superfamily n=1 Tax=Geosmithia morbida TaxID=1094350 RepID=A0A9P5D2U5_9HYPO|nr:Major Facilitator Superfamily [Geosmithia morbida]KAF4124247.1 Major Facilitator Superfamily [Geosmithia morbida]
MTPETILSLQNPATVAAMQSHVEWMLMRPHIMQDIICRDHLGLKAPLLPLDEDECLVPPVQRELNIVNAGIMVSNTIGGALVALPLGMLADRTGRVPILIISIFGIILSQLYTLCILWRSDVVPLRAIWGVGAFLLVGGGRSVSEAVTFALITDTAPLVQRAIWFQCVMAAVMAARALGPVIAGRFMQPAAMWKVLWVSLGLLIAGWLMLALFTPETLPCSDRTASVAATSTTTTTAAAAAAAGNRGGRKRNFCRRLVSCRPAMLLLPAAILTVPVATGQSDILVRLMPILFSWTLARSSLLLALCSLVILATLLILSPLAFRILDRLKPPAPDSIPTDLVVVRATSLLFLFGSFALMMIRSSAALIVGTVLVSLAAGTPMIARSLLVSCLDAEARPAPVVGEGGAGSSGSCSPGAGVGASVSVSAGTDGAADEDGGNVVGTLFGIVALGEIIAFVVCQLSMGALFDVGLHSWLGLPLLFGTCLALVVVVLVWVTKMPVAGEKDGAASTDSDVSSDQEKDDDRQVQEAYV